MNFTGWQGGKCYLHGVEMKESEVWAILRAAKISQVRAQNDN